MSDNQTRDRIRALVRDVLDKTMPDHAAAETTPANTPSRFIDTAPPSPLTATEATATLFAAYRGVARSRRK